MYASVNDIKDDWKKINFDDVNAIITVQKVENMIIQETDYINSWISNKYIVPVSEIDSPIAFNVLKRICIFRVSERIRNIIEVKTGEKQNKNYSRTPNSDLRDIQKGTMQLIDAIRNKSGTSSFNVDSGKCFEFDTSKQQW